MNKYLWDEDISLSKINVLQKNIKTDILIIGGGMAGVSLAFNLRDSNKSVTLIDQGRVGFGVTRGTTGKLTYLQDYIYQRLISNFNLDVAKKYYDSQVEAISIAKKNVNTYKIECAFQKNDSFIFSNNKKNDKRIIKEKEALDKIGCKSELKSVLPFPIDASLSLRVEDAAVFHPLQYLYHLKDMCLESGIQLYENTKACSINKKNHTYKIVTDNNYTIETTTVILCCHYPFFLFPGLIPFKTYLEKSYVASFSTKKVSLNNAISIDTPVHSIRYLVSDKRSMEIYLSNSHRLGSSLDEHKEKELLYSKVKDIFKKRPEYFWSNYDLITSDGLPYIGRLQKDDDSLYIATGFNTWGMTNGIIAGRVIVDLILENNSPYQELFSPQRGLSKDKVVNFFVDSLCIGKTYVLSKIKGTYSFYPSNVFVCRKGLKKYGIYIDKEKKKHIVSLLCPHMKCSLIFNNDTISWDCPCHGSRFDIDGNVIKGPSVKKISCSNTNEK